MKTRVSMIAIVLVAGAFGALLAIGFNKVSGNASPEVAIAAQIGDAAGVSAKKTGGAGAYKRWRWFKDSYWIVPQAGIYSVFHTGTNGFAVARGQTVFHITDYFNGYWTGVVTVKLTRGQMPSCQYVLGQVTPEGKVFMTMYDTETGEVINDPLGEMVKKRGEWTMVNTMTSSIQGGGTLSHWAYMVQSRRGEKTFRNLPFARESIPEFMSACPKGPPILHKPKAG